MARHSAYRTTGLFDATYGFISDVEMWLRLGCGTDVAYVPEPLIVITARESEKPHYGWPWRQFFWTILIYGRVAARYAGSAPETRISIRQFPPLIRKTMLRRMIALLRRRRWQQAKEGLIMWKDAPDPVLSSLGRLAAAESAAPSWYSPVLWQPLVQWKVDPRNYASRSI
jgi:hypothetical protein